MAALAVTGDRTSACMFLETAILVNIVRPADTAAFERGALGVLHPTYERRYLIRAYRRMQGLNATIPSSVAGSPDDDPVRGWLEARERVVKSGHPIEPFRFVTERELGNFSTFINCTDDSFRQAKRTLEARTQRYGAQSPVLAEWLRAQDEVLRNCGSNLAEPPEPAPAGGDPLARADRNYQIASSEFYLMRYDAAAMHFLAIAEDAASPWRPYGRYLAARSLIRRESVSMDDATSGARAEVLSRADRLLESMESDGGVPAQLKASAAALRGLVILRSRPLQRLHELSARLAHATPPDSQELTDYLMLFDKQVSPDTEYDYATIRQRSDFATGDDLTDWLMALQGTGNEASERALARWSETRSTHWLVAALWKVNPTAASAELLRAAAAVEPASPAFQTVAFLRARLLIARGERAEASRLVATLPDQPSANSPAEAVNLFRALRLQLAPDLATWLRAAPRFPMSSGPSFSSSQALDKPLSEPSFDVDAALALTESFPVDRLVEAAASAELPARLRLMVATEAWTRAVQLRRDEEGRKAAEILRSLAPSIRTEMDRYLAAGDADTRHYAGVLTILRWPTFRNYIPLSEIASPGSFPFRFEGPSQKLDIQFRKFWWCGFGPMNTWVVSGPYEETPVTRLPEIVYQAARTPPPGVISPADRIRATREFEALAAFGTAPNYLSREAVAWAKTRPKDPNVAEALARAVTSTQYGCSDKATGALSRQAFTVLHRQYPNTEWAKRTRYWYSNPY